MNKCRKPDFIEYSRALRIPSKLLNIVLHNQHATAGTA
jgi:hypothetical protein